MIKDKEKTLIGRRDVANLPQFGLQDVDVKVDSGAYTSSIHVTFCKEVEREGKTLLEVIFLDDNHPAFTGRSILFDEYRRKKVKSSTGQEQIRFFVKGKIELLGRKFLTEFSLTERRGMRYPILLGRKVLNKRFIIDTSLVNLSKKNNLSK
jgi:hypothetical protein